MRYWTNCWRACRQSHERLHDACHALLLLLLLAINTDSLVLFFFTYDDTVVWVVHWL
jgi:hypothetical protein